MTIDERTAKLLRASCRGRSRADLQRLFAAIRTYDNRALLAVIAPAKRRTAKRKIDPLVREVEQTLKPVLGPAAEKADLLVEHLAKKHRRRLAIAPKGLADAVRQLRAKNLSDDQIRNGAKGLVAHLAALYGGQETIV